PHAIIVGAGIGGHLGRLREVAYDVSTGLSQGLSTVGFGGLALIFLRAYSLGGGTYTGIEAVSNGLTIMREPRVETGKRTMLYMAISLAFTAGGILLSYLLLGVEPVEGKTMNAALAERVAHGWNVGPLPLGQIFIIITLIAE